MFCKYCEERKPIEEVNSYKPLYVSNKTLTTEVVMGDSYRRVEFKIKYCPMCGEPL
jgi:hypothetical protein